MPTAVVWGGLRAIIGVHLKNFTHLLQCWHLLQQCCLRYVNLYTLIRAQLDTLTNELARLKEYEYLFGNSPAMQELLKTSYLNILRFWTRVELQCCRPGSCSICQSVHILLTMIRCILGSAIFEFVRYKEIGWDFSGHRWRWKQYREASAHNPRKTSERTSEDCWWGASKGRNRTR